MVSMPSTSAHNAVQYLRITLTKFTIAFFLFGFIHCFAQGMIQSFIYTTDTQYSSFISTIMDRGEVPVDTTFAWLRRPGGIYDLQLCHRVPRARETTCNDLQSCPNIPRADERSCNPIFATSPGLSRPSKREVHMLFSSVTNGMGSHYSLFSYRYSCLEPWTRLIPCT
jgi:hypothetical protein